MTKRGEIKVSHLVNGMVVFNVLRGTGRRALSTEVEIAPTGDLRSDIARAARVAFPEGGRLAKHGDYCAAPSDALAMYGLTRETAPVGQASVLAPVWDVVA